MKTAHTEQSRSDDLATVIAVGVLAYSTADIAHHALGHGGMCLALGGRIESLSSIYVNCTIRGALVDLAGPAANLAAGLVAFALCARTSGVLRLFLTLAAGFNLLWFALQVAYSAATRTDDIAYAMTAFHANEVERYAVISTGLVLYWIFVRAVGRLFSPFGQTGSRGKRIVWTVWLAAGLFACFVALFDQHPHAAIINHAAPQSFALAIGILFLPRYVRAPSDTAPPIIPSRIWNLVALAVSFASIMFLGPGFALS